MENLEEKTEILDGAGESAESQNNLELNDIKGNNITIEDAKATLTHNSDLIQGAINGESKAFNELYLQSYRYVFFVIRQYISDDETTYDAIQETFIKVYKNIGSLRKPASYYGWLTSVAKNTAIDILRTKPSETELVYEEKNDATLKDEQTNKDVSLDVETVLKKLDPQDADLLSLVYYDGMRISQIAKMQGVPKTTVYSRFNKAKKNLKSQLKVHGIDKAIYSGNFVAMITTAIRNIIGTALLSFAIAQQILNSVIGKKSKKELTVAKIIHAQQKKAILKIASCIVAISMVTSAVTALTLIDWSRFKFSDDENYLTSTVTKYYYETDSDNGNSSQNSGGFGDDLFYNSSTSSGSSTTSNGSDSSNFNPYYPSNSSSASSSSSKDDASNNHNINGSIPTYSTPDNYNPTDDTDKPEEVVNVFGNNPNNVMRTISGGAGIGGMVAKQGDWLYYVQGMSRLIKVKLDGSQRQIIYESPGLMSINNLNVIGDTIYYTNGGIWSMKTDGTDRKLISSKTAYNLLVRGTTGWFIEVVNMSDTPAIYVKYSLHQVDLLTGEIITIVENGSGYGLKTVIDNYLIYVNGNNVYKRDLSTDDEILIKQFDFARGIYNMCVNGDTIYFCGGSADESVFEIDINNPNVIKATYEFGRVYNYFNYAGGGVYGSKDGGASLFYALSGDILYEPNESIREDVGIYTFDDGYVYYYIDNLTELHCCFPDGTEYKTY